MKVFNYSELHFSERTCYKIHTLSDDQINWLNYYNRLTREKVGAELKKQEKTRYVFFPGQNHQLG